MRGRKRVGWGGLGSCDKKRCGWGWDYGTLKGVRRCRMRPEEQMGQETGIM